MRNEFTAVVEQDGDWMVAYCPEIPGANGQGQTEAEAIASLSDAIALILEDRQEEGLRGVPQGATQSTAVWKEAHHTVEALETPRMCMKARR